MKFVASALLSAAAFAASSGAMAQGYVSGAVGSAHANVDCAGTTSCDDSDIGFKVTGGYGFGAEGLSAELGYLHLGEAKARVGTIGIDIEAQAITLGVAFDARLNDSWGLIARGGAAYVKSKVTARLGSASASDSDNSVQPYFGVGAYYAINKNVRIEAGADFTKAKYEDEKSSVRLLSIGARFSF